MSELPINPELYPDVVSAGGLVPAIQVSLDRHQSSLVARGVPGSQFSTYARVENGDRSSQVYVAAHERMFIFDIWRDGVKYGDGCSADIDEMTSAIAEWVSNACPVSEIERRACVQLVESAHVYDRGNEVEKQWSSYLSGSSSDLRDLMPFIALAAQQPILRALFPYTSLSTFCFSRCTGYPYSGDCPHVTPDGQGQFRVGSRPGGPLLGRGDAAKAMSMVLANLPANCGPAIRGNAEKLKDS